MLQPNIQEVNPIDILKAISDKKEQSLWPRSDDPLRDDNAGNRARFFTDLVKEESNKIQLSDSQFESIEKLVTSIEIPINEQFVQGILNKFSEVAKELTGDEKDKESPWNKFWATIQEKYQLSDEEIKMRQGDVINAYRMKIFALAQRKLEVDIQKKISEVPDKTGEEHKQLQAQKGKIVLAKDAILKINIADRDAKNESVMSHLTKFYQNKFAVNVLLKYEINEMIARATSMVKDGKSPEEVRNFIRQERESEWQKLIGTPMGDPNGEKYLQLFGQEKAKELFDKYFSEDKLYEKVENYAKQSAELGFDINSRIKEIEGLTGSKDIEQVKGEKQPKPYLSQSDKNALGDYVVTLRNMVYYPKRDIKQNDDILTPTSKEALNKDREKVEDILKGCVKEAIARKDVRVITLCVNTGLVQMDPTTDYKRDFGTRLKDGFKGFPKNLGNLFTKPPRSMAEIAKLYGDKDLSNKIIEMGKPKDPPPTQPSNEMLQRLSALEDKVQDLQQKVDTKQLLQTQPEMLPEMKESNFINQFGDKLSHNEEFVDALNSKDSKKLEHQFVESLMSYVAHIYSDNEKENLDQFKKVIDGLASVGCTSAQFFRAQAMLGNGETLKQIVGVEMPPQMYARNQEEGLRELSKIPKEATVSVHPNISDVKIPLNKFEDNVVSLKGKSMKSN